MSPDTKNKHIPPGDHVTKEEALLEKEADLELRCETVADVVENKIFPLTTALTAYQVSPKEYFGYMMLKNGRKTLVDNNDMAVVALCSIMEVMDLSEINIEETTNSVINLLRTHGSDKEIMSKGA